MPSRRSERISGLLLETVAETLLYEVKDPRVHTVTVTGVRTSPDLKTAKIFFVVRKEDDTPNALIGLQKATGFIRRQVANRLQLRHTPNLEFHYDDSLENANRLESLLRQAKANEHESVD